ncbi:hypothetical protein GCM10026983_11120 [Gracilibacillus alcaliphilus]
MSSAAVPFVHAHFFYHHAYAKVNYFIAEGKLWYKEKACQNGVRILYVSWTLYYMINQNGM